MIGSVADRYGVERFKRGYSLETAGQNFQSHFVAEDRMFYQQFRLRSENFQFLYVFYSNTEGDWLPNGNRDLLGHANYFFNGGYEQPGCLYGTPGKKCNHLMVLAYFRAAIFMINMATAYYCSAATEPTINPTDVDEAERNICQDGRTADYGPRDDIIGVWNRDMKRGVFYVPTTQLPPYFDPQEDRLAEIPRMQFFYHAQSRIRTYHRHFWIHFNRNVRQEALWNARGVPPADGAPPVVPTV